MQIIPLAIADVLLVQSVPESPTLVRGRLHLTAFVEHLLLLEARRAKSEQ